MAKRKRLSPAMITSDAPEGLLETKSLMGGVRPPIADVSGDASVRAALDEVTAELAEARAQGRIIAQLPLDAVDETHLVRDRVAVDLDDLAVLIDSISARGQQTPIEVVELGAGRYGLISGWRRLRALRALSLDFDDDTFATVAAVIRHPENAADAYLAMVEENEVRADLSFYERARIAVKAVEQGIHPNIKTAVQSLFFAATSAKRSKVLNFTVLVEALDDRLKFPANIPEKLGLALAAKLQEDAAFRRQLSEALRKADPKDAAGERAVLERALSKGISKSRPASRSEKLNAHLALKIADQKVTLSGAAVDDTLVNDLRDWLQSRASVDK